ncbi:DUF3995 domain-containing protein [Thermoflavimicrobium daqui]|uniref:DUF3995 domain-containing protein n=1 Tax=Thermoflavimicrobium daqui TaxID=2137476 RepID=UPI001F0C5ED7|nr:DUF3995 domain-containing protein [Thermoflavimicrobium daqui]
MASYNAGVLILVCGFILLTLVKPYGRIIPTWIPLIGGLKIPRLMILIPTLLCAAFLIAHGVSGMIISTLSLAGVITMKLPHWIVFDMDSLALWDLLLYQPWFLIMGILTCLTAAHYAHASGVQISTMRRSTVLYLIFVFLLTTFFVFSMLFDFADKISFF